ncbi:ATP-binding protein, partial [Streptomyces poonensis]|uniref:ATP-binding protein n=1 Tax=Streptomyces poonensis TaxID=68255 RepID=UPI0022F340BE
MGPHPAVAAIRLAVRRVLHDILTELPHASDGGSRAPVPSLPSPQGARWQPTPVGVPQSALTAPYAPAADSRPRPGGETPPAPPLVLVACSGGADSMALASALAFEAPRLGVRAGGITVDHGLQPGSDVRAAEVADVLRALGLGPVDAVAVTVGPASDRTAHG